MSNTERYLIETAGCCVRLVCIGRERAADLEPMSNDLMAKAVEPDTVRDENSMAGGAAA